VLDDEEQQGRSGGARGKGEDDARVPRVLGAAPAGQQDQAGGRGGQEQGAEDVEAGSRGRLGELQLEGQQGECYEA
jgi:hypothetical protein